MSQLDGDCPSCYSEDVYTLNCRSGVPSNRWLLSEYQRCRSCGARWDYRVFTGKVTTELKRRVIHQELLEWMVAVGKLLKELHDVGELILPHNMSWDVSVLVTAMDLIAAYTPGVPVD